jgi:hypothetical protein
MSLEDRIDNCPSGFHRIFARKECAITMHGIAQQSLVGCFLAGPII